MSRRLVCLVVLALFGAAPAALADGPQGGAVLGGGGAVNADGTLRFVTFGVGNKTLVQTLETEGGQPENSTILTGTWGIPSVTPNSGGGISADGKTLVLGKTTCCTPSTFLVLNAKTLRPRKTITLKGSFFFDALSPDGSRLFLIQHRDATDLSHYVVRAYDLRTDRLQSGWVADKTQKNWVMQGYATIRTTSASGRWVYTLYQNPGGYPFVHALDTVRGVAHCIGLPFTGNQNSMWNVRLAVRDGGRTLGVGWRSGKRWLVVNTTTWRITHETAITAPTAARSGGIAWRWPVAGVAAALLLALGLAAALRVRRVQPV
jgi:hypothetical protein